MLLLVEALAALVFGVLEVTHIDLRRPVVGAGAAALLLGYGAVLLILARGVGRGRRWSRGPVVASQLLHVLLAWSFRQGQTLAAGLALGGVALVVLVCLFTPAATAVLTAGDDAPPE